jgi:hypothetical protein
MLFDEADESVVDTSAVWQPEGGPGRQLVEHDEVLLLCNTAMVTLFGLQFVKRNCESDELYKI